MVAASKKVEAVAERRKKEREAAAATVAEADMTLDGIGPFRFMILLKEFIAKADLVTLKAINRMMKDQRVGLKKKVAAKDAGSDYNFVVGELVEVRDTTPAWLNGRQGTIEMIAKGSRSMSVRVGGADGPIFLLRRANLAPAS